MLDQVELIEVDNRDQRFTLPEALNYGMNKASGEIFVLCHHDVIFPAFWLKSFQQNVDHIAERDPNWGVLGIMGISPDGLFIGHIEDPNIKRRLGNLPAAAQSLDEVCLALRAESKLRFDTKLGGMHFYGADICLQARMRGMKCYVIDAPLRHLSQGTRDETFYELAKQLTDKWSYVRDAPAIIETTCGIFPLQRSWRVRGQVLLKKIFRKILGKLDAW